MTYFKKILSLVLVAGAASACSSDIDDEVTPDDPSGGDSTSGNEDTTYDHDNSGKTPFEVLAEQQEQGPSRYTAVIHKCTKIPYAVLGNVLRSRGIAFPGAANSAGVLYTTGAGQIGAPNFSVLLAKPARWTSGRLVPPRSSRASRTSKLARSTAPLPRSSTQLAPSAMRRPSRASAACRSPPRIWTSARRPSLARRTPRATLTKQSASVWPSP
jgi:hypothetical protein